MKYNKIDKYYEKKKERILLQGKKEKYKQELKDLKKSFKPKKKEKTNIQTSKLLMLYIFSNGTIIEIYSMVIMFVMKDISALATLMTTVISETISFAIYSWKAYHETKEEEAILLERDRLRLASIQPESEIDEAEIDPNIEQ